VRDAVATAELCPVEPDGRIALAALRERLARSAEPALISVMAANHETGVIQPIDAVVDVARSFGALVHCDAVQAAGRLPLADIARHVDYLSLSAHKLGGPAGVGALILGAATPLQPLVKGGGQERGRRAGTENVIGIAAFGAAAAASDPADAAQLLPLRDRLEAALRALSREVMVIGDGAPRLPNTSCVTMPGVPNERQVIAFDLAGIAVSAGAACSSGKVGPSPVLAAMGIPPPVASTAIRVSLGWTTTSADIDRFIAAWMQIFRAASGVPLPPPVASHAALR
jgi:cysteine desulfurase